MGDKCPIAFKTDKYRILNFGRKKSLSDWKYKLGNKKIKALKEEKDLDVTTNYKTQNNCINDKEGSMYSKLKFIDERMMRKFKTLFI